MRSFKWFCEFTKSLYPLLRKQNIWRLVLYPLINWKSGPPRLVLATCGPANFFLECVSNKVESWSSNWVQRCVFECLFFAIQLWVFKIESFSLIRNSFLRNGNLQMTKFFKNAVMVLLQSSMTQDLQYETNFLKMTEYLLLTAQQMSGEIMEHPSHIS